MNSGSVNAALLLSSYLGKEHEKIGQKIARSDFAGELNKLFPQKTVAANKPPRSALVDNSPLLDRNPALTGPAKADPEPETDKSASEDEQDRKASAPPPPATAAEPKSPEERLEAVKNRARAGKQTYITNPALLESIMAQLQVPSETISACKTMQNQQGWISLKDLNDLMTNLTLPTETLGQGLISADDAQALLSSIVQKFDNQGNGQNTFAAFRGGAIQNAGRQNPGYLTLDEFKGMLGQVLQMTNLSQVRSKAQGVLSGTSAGAGQASADKGEIVLQSAVMPRQGQTQSLTANILPSFLSDDSDESGRKKGQLAGLSQATTDSTESAAPRTAADSQSPAASRATPDSTASAANDANTPAAVQQATATIETMIPAAGMTAAGGFGSGIAKAAGAASTSGAGEASPDRYSGDTRSAAQTREEAAEPAAAAAPLSETGEEQAPAESRQSLASLAAEFGASIVSSGSSKSAPGAAESEPQADSKTASAQGQNLAPAAAEAIKKAETGTSAPQNQPAADLSETAASPARIVTQQAENSQDQPLPDYDANRSAGIAKSFAGADGNPASAPGQLNTSDSGASSYNSKQASAKGSTPAASDRTQAVVSGGAGRDPAFSSASIINKLAPGDGGSQYGASGGSGSQEQGWSDTGAGPAGQQVSVDQKIGRAVEDTSQAQAQELAGAAKDMEKQLKFRDAASDSAVLPGAAPRTPGSRIEVAPAQQASGGGVNYGDPGRMAEIIESVREQYRAAAGQHLVLELEPEQFGKMSIKVGARKDEVSAVVVTENESARQALLRNAPELRQSLDDQGLMLGKFQVDVDRDGTGGAYSREWRQQSGGDPADSDAKGTAAQAAPVRNRPVYLRRTDISQVSIIA